MNTEEHMSKIAPEKCVCFFFKQCTGTLFYHCSTYYCCIMDHHKIGCLKHPFVTLQFFRPEVQHCVGGLSVQNITRKKSQGQQTAFSYGAWGLLGHGTGNKIYACCYF